MPDLSKLTQLNQTTTELHDADQILEQIRQQNQTKTKLTTDDSFVAPRTPMERELAKIWTEFLGLERVGIYDDFFQLGGDSILAANILSRAQEMFQVQAPIDVLFEDTFTIARLAKTLEQYQIEQADPEEIAAMLAELNELSDDEVRALLEEE